MRKSSCFGLVSTVWLNVHSFAYLCLVITTCETDERRAIVAGREERDVTRNIVIHHRISTEL